MAWNGFLPKGTKCKACGAVLQGEGEGRPAESYAGTYTGLCNACTGAAPYDTGEVLTSGAHVWSHPPHAPSWRRERETHYGFMGCAHCRGTGSPGYGRQCPDCLRRHEEHPAVAEERERARIGHEAWLRWKKVAEKEVLRRCASRGLDARCFKIKHDDPMAQAVVDEVVASVRAECPDPTPEHPEFTVPKSWRSRR